MHSTACNCTIIRTDAIQIVHLHKILCSAWDVFFLHLSQISMSNQIPPRAELHLTVYLYPNEATGSYRDGQLKAKLTAASVPLEHIDRMAIAGVKALMSIDGRPLVDIAQEVAQG